MDTETALLRKSPPDRLLARTAVLALGVGLAVIAGAAMNLDQSNSEQVLTAELAFDSHVQETLAQRVAADLDRLSIPAAGPSRAAARERLAARVSWLSAGEHALAERAAALGLALPPAQGGMDDFLARLQDPRTDIAPHEAELATQTIRTELLPWIEIRTGKFETAARQSLSQGADALRIAFAWQIAGLAAVMLVLILPAFLRMRSWVRRADEAVETNRIGMLHDPLTKLPNVTYLRNHLARLAAEEAHGDKRTAVFRIDLDRYGALRKTLGQRSGDLIIRIAATRIQRALRSGDFAAHLGSDDFVVVAGGIENANSVAGIAQRIQTSLGESFAVYGGTRQLSCSIGVTLLDGDEIDPDQILADSEIALSEAQATGSGQVAHFRASQRREVEQREVLYSELIDGLERGQVVPYFQPQVDLATGALTGFEALVRWHHPDQGLLSPGAFVELAEQTDLIERVGEVVLSQSLTALRAWDNAGLRVPRIGVNFAMGQLRDPRLIEKIKWEVERFDIDPSRLAVEVLETVLIKTDADMTVRNLQGLASAGFQIELDDFGTGHASIANLRRFRVDCMKIDRSFIFGIETSPEQQILTASMIALARALGIHTLAEGIETSAAAALLREMGCDRGQGYAIAKPMSQAQCTSWLSSFHPPEAVREPIGTRARRDPNTP